MIAGVCLATFVTVLVLLWPRGCSEYDSPPGTRHPGPSCPRSPTFVGLVWPNIYGGLAGAPVVAGFVAAAAGAIVARRMPPAGPLARRWP